MNLIIDFLILSAMKRWLYILGLSATAYALPVGNPADGELFRNGMVWSGASCYESSNLFCDCFNIRIGFYGDYVYNRNLRVDSSAVDNPDVKRATLPTSAGYIVLNCWNWLDVFSTLGSTTINLLANSTTFAGAAGSDATLMQLEFVPYFSWSMGLRGTLYNYRCFSVGFTGQYFRTAPKLKEITRFASGDLMYFNANNSALYQEWQAACGAVYQLKCGCPGTVFAPYIAIKWAGGKMSMGDMNITFAGTAVNYRLRDLKPSRSWGYAVGTTMTVIDAVGINVEGRWADEKAVSVIGQLRF